MKVVSPCWQPKGVYSHTCWLDLRTKRGMKSSRAHAPRRYSKVDGVKQALEQAGANVTAAGLVRTLLEEIYRVDPSRLF